MSIVIPAYNEAVGIGGALASLMAFLSANRLQAQIIVVDDGSTDGTHAVAGRALRGWDQSVVIRHERNLGKGAAVRTGVLTGSGHHILFADADAPVPWEYVLKLRAALTTGADVAIGSKAVSPGSEAVTRALHRKVMSRCFNAFVQAVAVPGIQDTQCGFKLFTREAAHQLFCDLHTQGFGFDVEVLMRARLYGLRVQELPVSATVGAVSSVNVIVDSCRMLWEVVRLRSLLAHESRSQRSRANTASST